MTVGNAAGGDGGIAWLKAVKPFAIRSRRFSWAMIRSGAAFGQRLVGAEVVGVRMRVDDQLDRLVAHLGDRRFDLVAHRCDGSVDEQDAVIPDQDQGVAALPAEQIDPQAEICRLDLESRVIDPLRRSRRTAKRTQSCRDADSRGGQRWRSQVSSCRHFWGPAFGRPSSATNTQAVRGTRDTAELESPLPRVPLARPLRPVVTAPVFGPSHRRGVRPRVRRVTRVPIGKPRVRFLASQLFRVTGRIEERHDLLVPQSAGAE